MGTVYLANIDRPGLPAALAQRGIDIQWPGSVLPGSDHGLVLGWSSEMGSLADRLRTERVCRTGPLVVLLADPAEESMILALDAGADDAMPHSASDMMIAARLAALFRRPVPPGCVAVGDLRIDPIERRAVRAGRAIDLLPREYRLLAELAAHAGSTVSRPTLFSRVWGLSFDPGTNVLEVHVSRLRAKLDRGFAAPMLLTDKGRGYRLVPVG